MIEVGGAEKGWVTQLREYFEKGSKTVVEESSGEEKRSLNATVSLDKEGRVKQSRQGISRQVTEWGYYSGRAYPDPFNEVELDVVFTHSTGKSWKVPAYWAGGQEWRIRFAPPLAGGYEVVSICSDRTNQELHGVAHQLQVTEYNGENKLLKHGGLRITSSQRRFEYEDGTPFFWLGDTWWMSLCKRLSWPEEFQLLTADRKAKGFSVIQIVAGLYPDMPSFDERGANEAGFPWEKDFARINPAYFDAADLRIQWLIRSEMAPCIVGSWGYHLPEMTVPKMKQHWRNLVARWGSYPVIWCLAGESAMPYYLVTDKESGKPAQKAGWSEVGRYLSEIDPYHRLMTIHPQEIGRNEVLEDSGVNINMLQPGHSGAESVANTVSKVLQECKRTPIMPVVVGEVNYEGIMHGNADEVQRHQFWVGFLSGAAGHTYGANGIWQVNTKTKPFGKSPGGGNWGDTPWEVAYQLPGAGQLKLALDLLQRYPWWAFEPHQEWVTPPVGNPEKGGGIYAPGSAQKINGIFAAGIPRKVRILYFYDSANGAVVGGFESGVKYKAFYWNPRDGSEVDLGIVKSDAKGNWPIPIRPTMTDWALVFTAQ